MRTKRCPTFAWWANLGLAALVGALLLVRWAWPGLERPVEERRNVEAVTQASEDRPEAGPASRVVVARGEPVAAEAPRAGPEGSAPRRAWPEETEDAAQKQARVRVPVVFVAPGAGLEGFNAEQLSAMEGLRQWFVDAMGDAGAEPASPEYLEAWVKAQEVSDEQFSALFGTEAFVRRQILGVQQGGARRGN
jgi:hypothetical protein